MIKKIIRKLLGGGSSSQISEIDRCKSLGLTIGTHTIVHSPDCFDALYPWLIEVGDHCLISTQVKILAHDSSTNRINGITKIGRVTIGDHVYIGQGTTVLCNVAIGDHVVIGAHSLVAEDLPSDGVYAGVPAKRICSIEEFDQRHSAAFETSPKFGNGWKYWRDHATPEQRNRMKRLLREKAGYITNDEGYIIEEGSVD